MVRKRSLSHFHIWQKCGIWVLKFRLLFHEMNTDLEVAGGRKGSERGRHEDQGGQTEGGMNIETCSYL